MAFNSTRILEQLTGTLLVLVGVGFFVLLAILKYGGQLDGDLKISAFLFGAGAALIWAGYGFLMASVKPLKPARGNNNLNLFLLRFRSAGKLIATIGCVLMACRIISSLKGAAWPSGLLFEALLVVPVGIGLFELKILAPGAFQSCPFSDSATRKWSPAIRHLLNALLRVGWLGYLAIPLVWPDVAGHIPASARITTDVIACSFIFLLYASQFVVLHFGNMGQQRD